MISSGRRSGRSGTNNAVKECQESDEAKFEMHILYASNMPCVYCIAATNASGSRESVRCFHGTRDCIT